MAFGSSRPILQPAFSRLPGGSPRRVRKHRRPESLARRTRPDARTRNSSERLDSAAFIGFPPSRAFHRVPAFQTFRLGHPSRVRALLPELFSGVCPNPMKSPNHALQRTAPRVTARAFCERSGIYIWASAVRSTVGHAPRHAPPSLSLGSLGELAEPSSEGDLPHVF